MEPLSPRDPRQVGAYRLLARLGGGGMGQVYLGRTPGGRTVAVKLVRPEYAADESFRHRFRYEVQAARRVGGRWSVPVLDADTDGPQPWVATGYVAGPDLRSAVDTFGPLPPTTLRALGTGLAEALQTVHGLGLVHRDVKPPNVLLAPDGPRLIDFGIARALDGEAAALTGTGMLIGSPGYVSPEQAAGQQAGPASDVFALGAVLAFAATGRAPFGGDVGAPVLLYRVLHEEPDLTGVPEPLRGIVLACLAKDPARRPQLAELREHLNAVGPSAEQSGWLPPAIADAVARLAAQVLDFDSPRTGPQDGFTATMPGAPPGPGPMTVPGPPVTISGYAPGPERRRNRRLLPVVAIATAAVVIGGVVVLATRGHGDSPGSAAAPPTSTSSAAGQIPSAFLGSWSGSISLPGQSQYTTFPFHVTIRQAQGNDGTGQASVTVDGTTCSFTNDFGSATSTELDLISGPSSGGPACATTSPIKQVYTLSSPATITVALVGAAPAVPGQQNELTGLLSKN
ncbi:serine/threonine protein kinase [Catenulispora sp. NF23]|uniref:serine/threonine-protein kinase n=1 Tax=Catenulispora pinistramenti TaxID=2705254 RepID=UPI001BA5C29E|nr:serine/threonine-protein kinase [Catenulispora pinistramenti]MBS2539127.1 serine/threonine protein kinase [Catenulispora pinistramenti]